MRAFETFRRAVFGPSMPQGMDMARDKSYKSRKWRAGEAQMQDSRNGDINVQHIMIAGKQKQINSSNLLIA